MIVLGIDPGLANTGWGIVETRGSLCRARAYGCVSTKAGDSLDRRLGQIFDGVSEAIESFSPTDLAIEKIFFGENQRSAIATAHARGVAIVACARYGLRVGEYTPMQIKQAVVGTGAADKRQVIYMVRSILELDHDPRPDHCADALAAAICHANLMHTRGVTRDAASVEVFAQQQAQEAYEREEARQVTAAASAAHHAHGQRDRNATRHVRQSRRNS